jgi:hypothetical protein
MLKIQIIKAQKKDLHYLYKSLNKEEKSIYSPKKGYL